MIDDGGLMAGNGVKHFGIWDCWVELSAWDGFCCLEPKF